MFMIYFAPDYKAKNIAEMPRKVVLRTVYFVEERFAQNVQFLHSIKHSILHSNKSPLVHIGHMDKYHICKPVGKDELSFASVFSSYQFVSYFANAKTQHL